MLKVASAGNEISDMSKENYEHLHTVCIAMAVMNKQPLTGKI